MAKEKFYVEVDTFWQNIRSVFFGPYDTYEQAEKVIEQAGAAKHYKGCGANDVKSQCRAYSIANATESRRRFGRTDKYTVRPGGRLEFPRNVNEHADIIRELEY